MPLKARRSNVRTTLERPAESKTPARGGRNRRSPALRARYDRRPMRRLARIFAIAAGLVALTCLVLWGGGDATLLSRGGKGLTEVEVEEGNLVVAWEPRVPYRPQWAGQWNRYG